MQLFFNENISSETQTIQFSREESKHIVKVLRKKTGDILHITNGKGYLFKAEITLDLANKCEAVILNYELQQKSNLHLHIAIAPTKMNDRYEWFLEKACEIGIQEITPIICDHSERKKIKKERFQKIIQSACKQSLQYHLPVLNDLVDFTEFIENHKQETKLIAHCEETEKKSLKKLLQKNDSKKITILIGPEGDFSSREIKLAIENKYQAITLGKTRLRTETAGIIATHSVVFSKEI